MASRSPPPPRARRSSSSAPSSSTLAREYLSGSLASSITYVLFSPLEVVKTRLQLQAAPGWTKIHSGGLFAALRAILAQDGVLLSWSHGLAPGVARDFVYSGFRTGMYPTVRNAIGGEDARFVEKVAAGAVCGGGGAGFANAIDVVRVRMIAEGGRVDANGVLTTGLRAGHAPRWASSLQCAADCVRSEGVVGGLLLRGVSATVSRAGLLTAAQMSSYDAIKTWARERGVADGLPLQVVAAAISGFIASVASNPADVLKSRAMMAGGDGSVVGAAIAVARAEGLRGFYRGFWPQYARIGPTILVQLPVVEALRRWLGVQAI